MTQEELMLDKRRAVLQIQQWLRTLAQSGFPLPLIVPDGIYGPNTKEAVRIFQSLSGLAATGEVDYVTWLALRDDYRKVAAGVALTNPIFPFEYTLSDQKVTSGDRASLVYIIQALIEELLLVYTTLVDRAPSGIYDEQTAENIRILQEIWRLPVTGEVDRDTWNSLADAYNKNINKE
ncbi:MAG: peptidoglycan-binding protein [Clostridia bacterium]|nr:peptidoglycan-binding protein [Clostridia bacterium]